MKVIVAGSRGMTDYPLLKRKLDRIFAKLDKKKLVVLSGHAEGADQLGERWCDERLVRYEIHRPDWDRLGRSAGMVRNSEMVKEADALVCFWVNNSPGSADVILKARAKGIPVRIIKVGS
jgi:hypothetical protein